jgi:uncharacterized protein YndB with AHSA1/START domain
MKFLQSAPGDEPLLVEGLFKATPERVFRAWTEPDEVEKWFGHRPNMLLKAEIDLRVGGEWRFHLPTQDAHAKFFEGEYLTIDPARMLVFSWRHVVISEAGQRDMSPSSRVSVRFEPIGPDTTRLYLRHEAIQAQDARIGVGGGWEASFTHLEAIFAHP